jgi:hypothetical protein
VDSNRHREIRTGPIGGKPGVGAELINSRDDAAELFELVEETFDLTALAVERPGARQRFFADSRVNDIGSLVP